MAYESIYCPAVVSESIDVLSSLVQNNADNQWHIISNYDCVSLIIKLIDQNEYL